MSSNANLIFDIARGSFVDGPGIRTTVFFKGCPLNCPWCHNPESKSYTKEQTFDEDYCISCGNCNVGNKCFTDAKQEIGKFYPPEDLIEIIIKDKPYYDASNGGVTFSGGEALSFIPYLATILPTLKQEGIHIAFQTCGYFNYQEFDMHIRPYINLIFFDFKIFNKIDHLKILGKSNKIILENFEKLLGSKIKIIPRIPLIPQYIATEENLKSIAIYLKKNGIQECEFIYYNPVPGNDISSNGVEENKKLIASFIKKLRSQ